MDRFTEAGPEAHSVPSATWVVALGASAGGLDALREFFGAMAHDSRFGFVVVTHLPPRHVSHLAALLSSAGVLPASEAQAGQQIEGGRVYVMPPGQLMGLRDGSIFFEDQAAHKVSAPKPIDFFMGSLADDAADRSIGIVLSGTDHDGTAGLKAIKAAGGITIVQMPGTATFPGMPSSALDAGVADIVLAPRAMPEAIFDLVARQAAGLDFALPGVGDPADAAASNGLDRILAIVLAQTGNDFRWYRPGMLQRRLRRRMLLRQRPRLADYLVLLDRSPEEVHALGAEFLIGVTDFFRDPEAWQELADSALTTQLSSRQADDPPFRVWTPGCSSGEESYSIAMLILEMLEAHHLAGSVQVFGTDIDAEALAVARQGIYPNSITATVPAARLGKFFEQRGNKYIVRRPLRESVMFAVQNLIRDTPFSKLDLVCCRNVLMYFEPALQEQVFQLFHFALKPGGLLWLGKAESLGNNRAQFEPVAGAARLFRRLGGRSRLPPGFAGAAPGAVVKGSPHAMTNKALPTAEILRRQLGDRIVSAAVLADRDGHALHFHGDTARFLAPQGDATHELLRLVQLDLRAATRAVLKTAFAEGAPVERRVFMGEASDAVEVSVRGEAVAGQEAVGLLVITFTATSLDGDATPVAATDERIRSRDMEMDQNRRELALALEDAERSYEELRIAAEDASAYREELQSSNEELESSKEELQALNEELATVNAQLEDKMIEVGQTADDLANLLANTNIPTLLLDPELRLRRITPATAKIFNVRPGDEGRQLSDLSSLIDDPTFMADARSVLTTLHSIEVEVRGHDGTTLLRRIQPYMTGASVAEGIVATFVDVSALRAAAKQIDQLATMLDDSNDAVFTCDLQGRILSWNKGAERAYGYCRAEVLAKTVYDLSPASSWDETRQWIEDARQGLFTGPWNVDRRTQDGRLLRVSLSVSALRDFEGGVYALMSTERDLTEQLRMEAETRFRRLADDIPVLLRVENKLGLAEFVNRACSEFTGRSADALLGSGWFDIVHPEDRERYGIEHAAAQTLRSRLEIDLRLRRHDGVYRWVRSTSVPHLEPGGKFIGYVALMQDIEDRKLAESELADADRRKDEFLAMLAHELRNPIAPIRSAVSILSRSQQVDHRAEWAVEVIDRQAATLAKLLDGLLDVARIARGKTILERAPIEIGVVVQRATEVSQPLIDSRRQTLHVDVSEDLVVEGDLVRLTQVLVNLLSNSAKYTDEGGRIQISVRAAADQAVLQVSDNGAGLSADMVPRIFELFAQADQTLDRASGGLGIGLTLVRQLVELHHGTVQAESKGLGRGSTFTIHLPLLRRKEAAVLTDAAATASAVSPESRRILLVDDNIDGALALAAVLEMESHEVTVAHDGPKALAIAEKAQFDIVLLDIGLPGMDGYKVARALRGLASTTRSALIALTGYGQAQDIAMSKDAGFDLHLVKPVDPDKLALIVAKLPRLGA